MYECRLVGGPADGRTIELKEPLPIIRVDVLPEISVPQMPVDPSQTIEFEIHTYELNMDFRHILRSHMLRDGDILFYRHKEQ